MMLRFASIGTAVLGLWIAAPSFADTESRYASIAVGHVGILDSGIEDPEVLKLEFRLRPGTRWRLAPTIGAARSGNGANFVFAALERDFLIGDNWAVIPSFGLGSFSDGEDVKLGHSLEFRSGIKTAFRFNNGWRAGIALFHLSNGGLSDRNPGTEPLFLFVAVPL